MVRRRTKPLAVVFALVLLAAAPLAAGDAPRFFDWTTLPDLPLPLSGHFAGTSGGALIVVGGTNWPVSLFAGGTKAWYGDIYVLTGRGGRWRAAGSLPHALAYGGAVSAPEGLLCAGGADAGKHYSDVFLLVWKDGTIERKSLPPLPERRAYCGAALLDGKVYLAGGTTAPDSTSCERSLWALDLASPGGKWVELEDLPGRGRMLSAVAAQDGAIYVIGGCSLSAGPDGKPVRTYLKETLCYRPGKGWKRAADIPVASNAAPSAAYGPSHIILFGGDDGSLSMRIQELKENHPGFSRAVLAYHTITDTWSRLGTLPRWPPVTACAVEWEGGIVISGGEDRPGHRASRVLSAAVQKQKGHFFPLDYGVLGAYLAGMVFIGFLFSKRENTTEDFFLGGRRVPWWAAGLSIFGTQLSAITFMAIPAKVYATDWVYILGNICIVLVAPLVVFILGIFTRRANGPGTLIGAVCGAIVLYLVQSRTSVHFFLYAAVGIAACVVIGYVASLIIPAGKKDLSGLTIYTINEKERS